MEVEDYNSDLSISADGNQKGIYYVIILGQNIIANLNTRKSNLKENKNEVSLKKESDYNENRLDTMLTNNFGTKLNEYMEINKKGSYPIDEDYPSNNKYVNTENKKYGREDFDSNLDGYNNYTNGEYNSKLSMQSGEESNKSNSDKVNNTSAYEIKNTEEFNNSIYGSNDYFSYNEDPKWLFIILMSILKVYFNK